MDAQIVDLFEPTNVVWKAEACLPRGIPQSDVPNGAFVVGVPYDGGAIGRAGASLAPARIRTIARRLKSFDQDGVDYSALRLFDLGDIQPDHFNLEKTVERISRAFEHVFDWCRAPVVTFGGDHCVSYPIIDQLARRRKIGVVWFDAHPDVLDEYAGSRVSHGSPLRRVLEAGNVRPENVLLVGTRAYDPGEVAYLKDNGVSEIRASAFAASRAGAIQQYREMLASLRNAVDAVYVSIDIDVLDAAFVPGTGTPVSGGISTAELLTLIDQIDIPIAGCDVMEFSPEYDQGGVTACAVLAILSKLLGRICLQNEEAMC